MAARGFGRGLLLGQFLLVEFPNNTCHVGLGLVKGRHATVVLDPLRAVDRIAGMLCFFNERVDVEVDGELEGRPVTTWKHGVKSEAPAAARG